MALDIDWPGTEANPYRIFIPRADMPIVQASPEVRELDIDQLRKDLRDAEAAQLGAPWPETHRHQTQSTLSGTTFARIVEILPPYQVEFEDGQYSVRAVGANHNLLDVKVNNQVSLAVFLSSGLINSAEIERASFTNDLVTIDPGSAYSGTSGTTGNSLRPVNNMVDALAIAQARGLHGFLLRDSITVTGIDVSGYTFRGINHHVVLTIDGSANTTDCNFYNVSLQGTMSGSAHVYDSWVLNVMNIHGHITNSDLQGDMIEASGSGTLRIHNCTDGKPGAGVTVIDLAGSGSALSVRGHNGAVGLTNKTGADDVSVDGVMRLVLDSTVGGSATIITRGVGHVERNGSMVAIDQDDLLSLTEVSISVLDEPQADHNTANTMGEALNLSRKIHTNRLEAAPGTPGTMILYDDDGVTPLKTFTLTDYQGGPVVGVTGAPVKRSAGL